MSNDDLAKTIDLQFKKFDEKLDLQSKKFDEQFDKLFVYVQGMDKRLQYVEENMATKESIDTLVNTMDDFIRRIDNSEADQVARDAQFERLLDWARKVSKKTGIPLEGF